MRSRILLLRVSGAAILFCCTGFLYYSSLSVNRNVFDLSAKRLSGSRVLVSWHTSGETAPVQFEVMRTFSRKTGCRSIAVVRPLDSTGSVIADYRFVDASNESSDTSFYCLKKTRADGVVFYSVVLRVPGVRKG